VLHVAPLTATVAFKLDCSVAAAEELFNELATLSNRDVELELDVDDAFNCNAATILPFLSKQHALCTQISCNLNCFPVHTYFSTDFHNILKRNDSSFMSMHKLGPLFCYYY